MVKSSITVLRFALIAIAVLVAAPVAFVHVVMRASLPQVEGQIPAPELSASVSIERDSLGVPTIQADNRRDLAFGTGFVHGQDRFFQMDLSRRLAAGELTELFGEAAREQDQRARLFRFREVARQVLARATPEQRAIVEAYANGVNAGLANLRSRPWEYWVLRTTPRAWQSEDTILVVHAMWWDLQYGALARDRVRREINARLNGRECGQGWKCSLQFFYPAWTAWDSPNIGIGPHANALFESLARGSGVPSPSELDVRGASTRPSGGAAPARPATAGSNNWAVAGRFTATGAALVANDMHLGLRVPATWYRARLRLPSAGDELDLNGLTLPGAPVLVVGSNRHIAWGFTNSYGDWADVIPAPCASAGAQTSAAGSSGAGVLLASLPTDNRCWIAQWLASVPAATNLNLLELERVRSVEDALSLAPRIGIPHQNLVVGDHEGHIGWTIYGRIPAEEAADRSAGLGEWTDAQSHPSLMDPPAGRLWTANGRAVQSLQFETQIGGDEAPVGADYVLGARARQIRDALMGISGRATPMDMLRIQLDDRALLLSRWRELVIELLDATATRDRPERTQFRDLVTGWNGRATTDSVGYRLVRAFRDNAERAVWSMLLEALDVPSADASVPMQFERPLWTLVTTQPLHMLAAEYDSWRELLLAQLDITIAELQADCGDLVFCTWGSRNLVRIRHPLSAALPFLSRLIDMPAVELPGDHDMPRVQDGTFGASERFAVSPGHEDQGYLHMPGGQSGHPLSPYYRAGFRAWAEGRPLPFLPGPPQYRLVLRP